MYELTESDRVSYGTANYFFPFVMKITAPEAAW